MLGLFMLGMVYGAQLSTTMSRLNARSAEIDYRTCQAWTTAAAGTTECPTDYVLTGVACGTSSCATVQIQCCRGRGTHDGSTTVESKGCKKGLLSYTTTGVVYSKYAAHLTEKKELRYEGDHLFATGIYCGSNTACNEIKLGGRQLQCVDSTYLIEDEWRDGASSWSGWISEAGEKLECPRHTVVTGINCTGLNCQKIRIQCSPFGHVCPIGYYGDNIFCYKCPQGRYGATAGLTASFCSGQCAKGTYGTTTGLTKATCNANCPKGTYRDTEGGTGLDGCTACPAGVYGETEALTSKECTAPCPVGTYRPTTGAMDVKDCIRCPRETYIPTTGSTSCLSCPAGTYSIKLGSYSLDDCKTCPPSYRGNKCTGGVEAVGG